MAASGYRAAASLLLAILVLLLCSSTAYATPTITSVIFYPPASNPDGIGILGTGFGNQPPPPSNPIQPPYTGSDYGNALYLCDTTPNPNAFCAGQNSGGGGDTIGLSIYEYQDGAIGLDLGSSYSQYYYPNDIYRLEQGDRFTLNIEGATCSGTVSYNQSVPCSPVAGCATRTTLRDPSLQVAVDKNNDSDIARGQGWAPNEQVNIYLDTAAGAHYIGTTTSDSAGNFTPTSLAPFARFLPIRSGERQADPNETFPIVAMDGSCDAATVTSLAATTHGGQSLTSSQNTSTGACSTSGVGLSTKLPNSKPPVLPLRTDGRWIVDGSRTTPPTRVKLTSVNWYGAEEADFVPGGLQCQSLDTIAGEIASMGFNSVRLPWSNAMYEQHPSTCTRETSS